MTRLLYLEDGGLRSARATVLAVDETRSAVILDATPAYPKGGGQPADHGLILGEAAEFVFEAVVQLDDGDVEHRGRLASGDLRIGDEVKIELDWPRRRLTSRLHTAGELICAALHELGHRGAVTAASHVPGQCRVAFRSQLGPSDMDELRTELHRAVAQLISADRPVVSAFAGDAEALSAYCPAEADKAFTRWPVRVISVASGFWRPCLGAHAASTKEVGRLILGRVRVKAGEVSISYDLEPGV